MRIACHAVAAALLLIVFVVADTRAEIEAAENEAQSEDKKFVQVKVKGRSSYGGGKANVNFGGRTGSGAVRIRSDLEEPGRLKIKGDLSRRGKVEIKRDQIKLGERLGGKAKLNIGEVGIRARYDSKPTRFEESRRVKLPGNLYGGRMSGQIKLKATGDVDLEGLKLASGRRGQYKIKGRIGARTGLRDESDLDDLKIKTKVNFGGQRRMIVRGDLGGRDQIKVGKMGFEYKPKVRRLKIKGDLDDFEGLKIRRKVKRDEPRRMTVRGDLGGRGYLKIRKMGFEYKPKVRKLRIRGDLDDLEGLKIRRKVKRAEPRRMTVRGDLGGRGYLKIRKMGFEYKPKVRKLRIRGDLDDLEGLKIRRKVKLVEPRRMTVRGDLGGRGEIKIRKMGFEYKPKVRRLKLRKDLEDPDCLEIETKPKVGEPRKLINRSDLGGRGQIRVGKTVFEYKPKLRKLKVRGDLDGPRRLTIRRKVDLVEPRRLIVRGDLGRRGETKIRKSGFEYKPKVRRMKIRGDLDDLEGLMIRRKVKLIKPRRLIVRGDLGGRGEIKIRKAGLQYKPKVRKLRIRGNLDVPKRLTIRRKVDLVEPRRLIVRGDLGGRGEIKIRKNGFEYKPKVRRMKIRRDLDDLEGLMTRRKVKLIGPRRMIVRGDLGGRGEIKIKKTRFDYKPKVRRLKLRKDLEDPDCLEIETKAKVGQPKKLIVRGDLGGRGQIKIRKTGFEFKPKVIRMKIREDLDGREGLKIRRKVDHGGQSRIIIRGDLGGRGEIKIRKAGLEYKPKVRKLRIRGDLDAPKRLTIRRKVDLVEPRRMIVRDDLGGRSYLKIKKMGFEYKPKVRKLRIRGDLDDLEGLKIRRKVKLVEPRRMTVRGDLGGRGEIKIRKMRFRYKPNVIRMKVRRDLGGPKALKIRRNVKLVEPQRLTIRGDLGGHGQIKVGKMRFEYKPKLRKLKVREDLDDPDCVEIGVKAKVGEPRRMIVRGGLSGRGQIKTRKMGFEYKPKVRKLRIRSDLDAPKRLTIRRKVDIVEPRRRIVRGGLSGRGQIKTRNIGIEYQPKVRSLKIKGDLDELDGLKIRRKVKLVEPRRIIVSGDLRRKLGMKSPYLRHIAIHSGFGRKKVGLGGHENGFKLKKLGVKPSVWAREVRIHGNGKRLIPLTKVNGEWKVKVRRGLRGGHTLIHHRQPIHLSIKSKVHRKDEECD